MPLHRYLVVLLLLACIYQAQAQQFQGYGADMPLRIDQQLTVASQAELINALRSHVLIRFAPGVKLNLTSNILVKNLTNIYISGPVTLTNFGIYVEYCQNIILKNIRLLNSSIYGILIYHSNNVIVDHCTIIDSGRTSIDEGKCIDITQQTKNVTVSYNILAYNCPIQQLLKYKGLLAANFLQGPVENVSLHHNIFYCVYQRSPEISTEGLFDMRQNIIFNYTEYGSRIRNNAYGNFISNWYIGGKKDPLVFLVPEASVFSVANTWKLNCVEDRALPDLSIRGEYNTPTVRSRRIQDVVAEAGCSKRELWELRIAAQVNSHL